MESEELVTLMRGMYDDEPNKLYLERTFEARQWKLSKRFAEYFSDKLVLRNRLIIPEDEWLEYLIEGIPDTVLRN